MALLNAHLIAKDNVHVNLSPRSCSMKHPLRRINVVIIVSRAVSVLIWVFDELFVSQGGRNKTDVVSVVESEKQEV